MIYLLYINGRLYKTYKQLNHMTAAIRLKANRRNPPKISYKQIDETSYSEFDAMDLLPPACDECGKIPTRIDLRNGSLYWHDYNCSQRNR